MSCQGTNHYSFLNREKVSVICSLLLCKMSALISVDGGISVVKDLSLASDMFAAEADRGTSGRFSSFLFPGVTKECGLVSGFLKSDILQTIQIIQTSRLYVLTSFFLLKQYGLISCSLMPVFPMLS